MAVRTGKLLRVNLTTGAVAEEVPAAADVANYLGGMGLAAAYVAREVDPSADALSPANKLVFMAGPLSGTLFPAAPTVAVAAKSPETGIMGLSACAGGWGAGLKQAGYDGIILEGRADKLSYLSITDKGATLGPAENLKGAATSATREKLRETLGAPRARVAAIGPAGEKGAWIATIETEDGHALGRGGLGAVMGSKNLKAIVVSGNQRVRVADPARFRELSQTWSGRLAGDMSLGSISKWGVAGPVDTLWSYGMIPAGNWQRNAWDGFVPLGGAHMERYVEPHPSCENCPIRCTRWVSIADGPYAMEGAAPDYQSMVALGALPLNADQAAVCKANALCHDYGLDTISTGSVIAFALEAFERGIITMAEAGATLAWGDAAGELELIKHLGEGRGAGATLAQGVRRAAERMGQGSDAFAVHVKGLEPPMYDPRAVFAQAGAYAVGPTGADWQTGLPYRFEQGSVAAEAGVPYRLSRFTQSGKGMLVKAAQDMALVSGSLGLCPQAWLALAPYHLAQVAQAAVGEDYDSQKVLRVGERTVNAIRRFNLACGLTRADDKLPARMLEPRDAADLRNRVPDVDRQVDEYYAIRGWDAEGVPGAAKLSELGLAG